MLINCPNCGKPVSDTSQKCMHCGYAMKNDDSMRPSANSITQEKTDYFELSKQEQQSLFADFKQKNPAQSKVLLL